MDVTRRSPKETLRSAVEPLNEEEVRIISNLRLMRASARKMILAVSEEYARDFPEPNQFKAPN